MSVDENQEVLENKERTNGGDNTGTNGDDREILPKIIGEGNSETLQQDDNAEQVEVKTEESPKQEEKRKPRSQQRIEQLVQEKKELQDRLKAYEALEKPNAEKYDDDDEYEIDKTAYVQQKANEKLERQRLKDLEDRAKQETQSVYQSATQDFQHKVSKASEATREFIANNARRHKPRSQDIEIDIMDSQYAPEIFEVILQDVDRYNGMSDTQFIKAVAKIEAKFENANKTVKPPLSVPNPPTTLDQSNTGASAKKSDKYPDWAYSTYAKSMRI